MPLGRPSSYTQKMADSICEELATTDHSLLQMCKRPEMPALATIYRWFEAFPAFREKYARAKDLQAEVLAAQVVAIADDASGDNVTRLREDGSEYEAVDHDHINRSRLRVDARKWYASKLAPKKYGDKLELAGDQSAPIQTRLVVEFKTAAEAATGDAPWKSGQ